MKLFTFHFSGGSKYSFRDLQANISEAVEVINLELPGRGSRINEPLLYSFKEMLSDIHGQIRVDSGEPFALYGHSLGAYLAYESAVNLNKAGGNMPVRLFVSGVNAPTIKRQFDEIPDDKTFLENLLSMGGIPHEVANNQDMLDFCLPILKADFTGLSSYKCSNHKLDMPITVFAGDKDSTYERGLNKWAELTNAATEINLYSGNHFFIYEHGPDIGFEISSRLLYGC